MSESRRLYQKSGPLGISRAPYLHSLYKEPQRHISYLYPSQVLQDQLDSGKNGFLIFGYLACHGNPPNLVKCSGLTCQPTSSRTEKPYLVCQNIGKRLFTSMECSIVARSWRQKSLHPPPQFLIFLIFTCWQIVCSLSMDTVEFI